MHYLDKVRECVKARREYNTAEELFRRAENQAKMERYREWRSEKRQNMVHAFSVALEHCPITNLQNAVQALEIEYLSLSIAKRAFYVALNTSADNLRVMTGVAKALGVDISD